MSFFGKFKSNATPASPTLKDVPKKDPNQLLPTAIEKHIADLTGPARLDGSDKFFGFENYSSTCYCNSILQCLYYSAPFRDHVINFPPQPQLNGSANHDDPEKRHSGPPRPQRSPLTTKPPPATPGPLAANSPARRPLIVPGTPQAQNQKPDEKDSPEWKKKLLMQAAPMLDMQLDYSDTYGMQESLFTALKDIFEAIISQSNRTGIVSPHKFLEILRKENEMFRSAMHQDAHEFLNLLLNQVVDTVELYSKQQGDALRPAIKDSSMTGMTQPTAITKAATGWVHELFEGLLVSETRCLTCENTSQRDEAFMDLSVDLDAHSSVTSCLRKFSEEEMLCERNKFHCDNCGGLQEAEKRMKIKRLPRILALHLKRFKYTEDYNRLQKLFHRVVYPFHLRLFNTTDDAEEQDRLYELYAVVVHIGGGPYHGHYVSIIKTQDRGWLLFDDELVEPVSKSYVQNFFGGEPKPGVQDAKQSACAYVLFYQETTLEAVQKEAEAEAHAAATAAAAAANASTANAAVRTSDVASPTSPTAPSSLWTNGLKAMQHVATPTEEKDDQFAKLSHAISAPPTSPAVRAPATDAAAPIPSSPAVPQGANGSTITTAGAAVAPATPQVTPQKSKKDLKKESKERKKEEKEAAKEAERQKKEKMREAMERRRELRTKAESELQAAIEASKLSKAEEDAKVAAGGEKREERDVPAQGLSHAVTTGDLRGEAVGGNSAAPAGNGGAGAGGGGGGLGARFRQGSISLRQKKGFWGVGGGIGKKDKDLPGSPVLETKEVPNGNGAGAGTGVGAGENEKEEGQVVTSQPVGNSSPSLGFGFKRNSVKEDGEGKEKKNRFSMGRKKSAVFS